MTLQIDLKPEMEAQIKAQAQAQGLPVETFVMAVIEKGLNGLPDKEDPRIAAMHDAMSDQLFLADLKETMEDFKHVDLEHSR